MAVRIYSDEERVERSRALQQVHAKWASDQIADGVDGATPPGRPEPSDYNQHVPDMEASGLALDDFWDKATEALKGGKK